MKIKMRCGYPFEIEEDSVWLTLDGRRMRFLFGGEDAFDKMSDQEIIDGVNTLKTMSNGFKSVRESISNWGNIGQYY